MTEQERVSTGGNRSASGTGSVRVSRLLDPTDRYFRAGAWLLAAPQELAWWTGLTYQGHNLKRTDDGWLLIMKARGKKGPVVSFTSGPSVVAVVELFAESLTKGLVTWKPDRYAKT